MDETRDIAWYIDRAKINQNYSSDRQFCLALKVNDGYTTYIRKRGSLPSPEKMVEIAKLAGVDPAIALTDLAIWNSSGEAKETYGKILAKLMLNVLFVVMITLSPAQASNENNTATSQHYEIQQSSLSLLLYATYLRVMHRIKGFLKDLKLNSFLSIQP